MSINLIIHSPININCSKFVSSFIRGNRYFKCYNTYLIPYHCKNIDYNNKIISGNYIYPIWNTIGRTMITTGAKFNYSYLKGNNYTIEYDSDNLDTYHIFRENHIYTNAITIYEKVLKPNNILLFPIHKEVADRLIYSGLM